MPDSAAITVDRLTKRFGDHVAVDDLSFTVRPGAVTGFLGPNGAGKSTTLRMLLGLCRPTSGTALIGDRAYADIDQPTRLVGAALGATDLHPGRTGLDHLRCLAPQAGVDTARCHELLELVDLTEAARRRVGGYSLGMRQRLSLATALLGDPSVVVFDEPANGLDPQGIVWLRDLLRSLARQGRTVLVSSHVLGEVQHTVDDVVVIGRGRLLHESSLAGLEALAEPEVEVLTPTPEAFEALAVDHRWSVRHGDDGLLIVRGVSAAEVGAAAYARRIELHRLSDEGLDLEGAFLKLTGQHPDSVADPGVAA